MAIEKIFLGTTTGDKTGTGAKAAGQIINNNFDYLEAKIDNASYLIAETGFSLTDQNLTMNSGWEWLIVGVNYTNPAAVVINIPFAETGKQRIDLIVMNQSNTFQRIAGTESISNPVAPPMPKDKLQATLIVVSDGAISEPLQPIVGSDYILKQESYDFLVSYYDAVIEQVDLNDHRASLNFMGANTDVKSIALSGEFMRNGKIFTFKNHNATPLTIWHNSGTGNVKMMFSNEENFVLQPNEVIQFSLNYYDTSIPRLEYIGIISSGKENIANKQNSLAIDGTGTKYPTVDAVNAIPFNNVEVTDIGDKQGVFAIVGDSFTIGAGSTSMGNRFSTIVSNSVLNSSNGYGYGSIINMAYAGLTTTGTYIGGGVVNSRLSLADGQSITITNKVARYYDVVYDASLSTGSLEFRLNGVLLFTKTITGTGLKTTYPTIMAGENSPVLLSDTVTITSVGGTVVVTSLDVLKQAINVPRAYVIGKSGTGYQDYVTSDNLDEIAYYLNSRVGVKSVLLALGTNNIYSVSKHLTPTQTTDNITLFINGIISRCGASNFIITIPSKSNESVFPIQEAGYSYEDYVNHIFNYCKVNGHSVVRYDQTQMGTGNGSYLSDGLHPNDLGHKILANKINETLGIVTKSKTAHWEPTFVKGKEGEIVASGSINEVTLSLGSLATKNIINTTSTSTATVTETITETLLYTAIIPANSLGSESMPNLKVKLSKSGTAGTFTLRVKVNTVNDFATATTIGTYTSATTTNQAVFVRNVNILAGNIYVSNATSSLINDEAAATTGSSTITYDQSVIQYWFFSIQNTGSGDSTKIRGVKLVN